MQELQPQTESLSESVHEVHEAVSAKINGESENSQGSVDGRNLLEHKQQSSTTLRRASYGVLITLGYAVLGLFAWVITCIASYRPIGAGSYVLDWHDDSEIEWENIPTQLIQIPSLYSETARYLKVARVIQSIVSLFTIPVTSAVCSWAAVAFLQQRKLDQPGPTLRQSMALADKVWTDPIFIAKLFLGGWKQYGSRFLLVAIILNGLGAAISPLQEILVSYKTIKVPTSTDVLDGLVYLTMLIDQVHGPWEGSDGGLATIHLRFRLESVARSDPQFRLWAREPVCGSSVGNESNPVCGTSGGYAFDGVPLLQDPFWCQLPSGFNTGLIQQFAPRVNFTTRYENVTSDAFPQNCGSTSESLYIRHESYNNSDNADLFGDYAVDICMPNITFPWKVTDSRQDFSEELYLNITLGEVCEQCDYAYNGIPGNYMFKVTLNTSAGYFELPNYMNNQLPGPLLDGRPTQYCGDLCVPQGYLYTDSVLTSASDTFNNIEKRVSPSLQDSTSNGPLLYITLALFGYGSYLDINHTTTETYLGGDSSWEGCIDMIPLAGLLGGLAATSGITNGLSNCVDADQDKNYQQQIVMSYLWMFAANAHGQSPTGNDLENAFTAAAFLSFDEWALAGGADVETVKVVWCSGIDLQTSAMSRASMILISLLLGLYLASLLALSLFAARVPRWTNQLDSFAMMRIGASIADRLPLKLADQVDKVKILDELPGWIGDTIGADDVAENGTKDGKDEENRKRSQVGELGLGGWFPLKRDRKYQCYATDSGDRSSSDARNRNGYSRAPNEPEID